MANGDRQPDARGDLTRYPLPRLLYYLYKKQFLGDLEINAGEMQGQIHFRDGLPVFADMPFPIDVLGRVLVDRNLIQEEQLYASLQQLAGGQQLQGQILIQMGALDMGGLIEGLRTQLLRKLNRSFTLRQASFAIYSGEHGRGLHAEEAQVRADPLWVIYHGVRNTFDASRLQPEMVKLQNMAVRLPESFEDIWPRYGMGEEMQPLIMLLMRGALPVDRIYSLSNVGPLPTQMLVYALWVTEALEVLPVGRSARGSHAMAPVQHRPSQPVAPVQHRPSQPAAPVQPAAPQPAAPVQPTAPQPVTARPPYEPPRRRMETAPEVQTLAQAFTGDLVLDDPGNEPAEDAIELLEDEELDDPGHEPAEDAIELLEYGELEDHDDDDDEETTDGGTPIITSAPVKHGGPAIVPELGQEGVYEIPQTKRPAEPSATPDGLAAAGSQPIAHVPSSPGQPISRVPSSPGQPISRMASSPSINIDAGAAAKHYQLVRKTHRKMKEGASFYEMLEVDTKSSPEQIRDAYFGMAKDFHPDRVTALGLKDVAKEAEEIFRCINEAHTTLTNKDARAEYDTQLKGAGKKQEVHDALTAEFAFQKGMVHFRKKNFPEALKSFQDSFKLNPKEGEHLAYIAWTLFSDPKADKKKLLPKVKEQLLKSIRISPNSATCHYFLGEVYQAMGEERRAFTCFDKVLEIQPNHLEATRHMRIIRMRKEKKKGKDKKTGLFGRFRKKD